MRWPMVLAMLVATLPVDAQEGPNARERVYILADSLNWRLAYHTLPDSRTVVCEVATREQPGAIYRKFFQNQRSFTVYLMESAAPIDSFVLQVDDKRPVLRSRPTKSVEKTSCISADRSSGATWTCSLERRAFACRCFTRSVRSRILNWTLPGSMPCTCAPFNSTVSRQA